MVYWLRCVGYWWHGMKGWCVTSFTANIISVCDIGGGVSVSWFEGVLDIGGSV